MVKKAGKHMEKAKSYGIQVVPESFVDACKEGGNAADHLISMNLASWGSNVSFLYIYFFFLEIHYYLSVTHSQLFT